MRDELPEGKVFSEEQRMIAGMKPLLTDVVQLTSCVGQLKLRAYQEAVAETVVESVLKGLGLSIAVMFPRQSGKNELQAQIEAHLLFFLKEHYSEMVKISPTWKPQSLNAMRRLERALNRNLMTRNLWRKEAGYIYRVGKASIAFLSGSPETNIVGATASALLEVDEAQDVQITKFDREIAPMAASTNATRVFWGTAWTSRTLLAREVRAAQEEERKDGVRRTFMITADVVGKELPNYRKFVEVQTARLGRSHPLIRTQYYCEEIDGSGGMFPPARLALMGGGDHDSRDLHDLRDLQQDLRDLHDLQHDLQRDLQRDFHDFHDLHDLQRDLRDWRDLHDFEDLDDLQDAHTVHELHAMPDGPEEGKIYAALLDLAGEDEGSLDEMEGLQNPGRDLTALTVVEVDLGSMQDELLRAPTYRVAQRYQWVGVKHSELYGRLKALIEHWRCRKVVADATGVGAGLVSFLARSLGERVIPFVFTSKSKSQLGWDFLNICDTGRWKEPSPLPLSQRARGKSSRLLSQRARGLQEQFWVQCEMCEYQVLDGPGKMMRWGVPDGKRHPETGELVHDDLLVSAALSAVLDRQLWTMGMPGTILQARDVLEELDEGY